MPRAAIYVRASTDHQQYSTANQRAALQAYARAHKFEVIREFEDNGRSGLDLRGRPALQQLLHVALCVERPFDVLLVYDVSRWGRFQDTDESAHYEFLCRRAGLKIIYCAECFPDDGTALSTLVKSMKRVMAAEYSLELSRKVLAGQCRLAASGKLMGRPPLGLRRLLVDSAGRPKGMLEKGQYKNIHTDRVVLAPGPPEEVGLVVRIFRLFGDNGLNEYHIAQTLTEDGIRPCFGRRWRPSTVLQILKNEKYIGNLIYNKTTMKLHSPRTMNPQTAWIRVDGVLKPIVDPVLFQRVQEKLADQKMCLSMSDEGLLNHLRPLLKREGKLSRRLIDGQVGLPSARVYTRRFGTLRNAYKLAGRGLGPFRQGGGPVKGSHRTKEELIADLKDLLARQGELSARIINQHPEVAVYSTYQKAFGSLRNAYAAIGYAAGSKSGSQKLA